jgi:hypothetical protein
MSTTIDLGKLRFNWVGTWVASTEYEINDLVKHGGDVFVYIYGVKTVGNLTTNTIYWALVQEGMAWQGEYDATVAYLPHQVVHHANNSYICILEEPVAGATEPPNSTYWQLLVTGYKFEGLYNDSTTYQVDDIVYYGANTFICIQNTTGTKDPEDTAYWAIFSHGMRWVGVYDASVTYRKDDILTYGINAYVTKHDVTGSLPTDASHFDRLTEGLSWENVFDITTAYQKNDIVKYGTNVYIAKQDTVGKLPTVTTHWDPMSEGLSWENVFDITTSYQKHDVVKYGTNVYIAKLDTVGTLPTDVTKFDLMSEGLSWENVFDITKSYQKHDVVKYGTNLYIAKLDTVGHLPTDATKFDPMSEGMFWENLYNNTTSYQKHDVVKYGSNTYIAKLDTVGNLPTVATKWDLFAGGIAARSVWNPTTLYYPDDVVTYSGNTFRCLLVHTSSTLFAADRDLTTDKRWEKFSSGMEWKGHWTTATEYRIDDIIEITSAVYRCNTDHISTDFASNIALWDIFAAAGTNPQSIINTHGQILVNDGTSALAALDTGKKGYSLTTNGPNADVTWESLFSLHKMEITEDTHELIADYSGPMSDISEYININHTTGQLEMEVNDGTVFSIDRDTGSLLVEI